MHNNTLERNLAGKVAENEELMKNSEHSQVAFENATGNKKFIEN